MRHKFLGETLNFSEILRVSKMLMKHFKMLGDLGLIGVGTLYLMKWLPGKSLVGQKFLSTSTETLNLHVY